MATKDLSRSVIEGGRYHGNASDRRRSHAEARTKTRAHCRALLREPELADAANAPRTERITRRFRDKLAPAERWLRSQVGRPWRKVEGEILARFDLRTIAGRHVVFDHLLPAHVGIWPRTTADLRWRVHRAVSSRPGTRSASRTAIAKAPR